MAPRMGYLLLRAMLAPCAERNRAVAPLRSLISLPFLFSILLVADLFQPIDVPAVDGFLDGDVTHPGGRRGSMPVLHSGRNAHYIARPDLLKRAAPALHQPLAGGHHHDLADRLRMPCGARSGLERHQAAGRPRRRVRREERVDAHRAGEELPGPLLDGWEPARVM